MRDVLVVLFWTWLLVALGVYAYRVYRRVTKGPKAERLQGDTDASTPEASGTRRFGRLGPAAPPPLPEGPVEARLPRSLQGTPAPSESSATVGTAATDAGPVASSPTPEPAPRPVTLAEALQGIQMPEGLVPVISTDGSGLADDRRARFSATGTNVPLVAVSLTEELRRLGYAVDGMDTLTSTRAGLTAVRDTTAVAATIDIDDDTGAVVVELKV